MSLGPGQLCAKHLPDCFGQSSWLKMTNPAQDASVKRGDLSQGFVVSHGSPRQETLPFGEGLGPVARQLSLSPLHLCVSVHFILLPLRPGPGATRGYPMAPKSMFGTFSDTSVLSLHLELLISKRERSRLAQFGSGVQPRRQRHPVRTLLGAFDL